MVAKVLCAALDVLEADPDNPSGVAYPSEMSDWCPTVGADRPYATATAAATSPLRQAQVAQLVGVPYGAMMPPTSYFSSWIFGPSL